MEVIEEILLSFLVRLPEVRNLVWVQSVVPTGIASLSKCHIFKEFIVCTNVIPSTLNARKYYNCDV